jgi:hypothetical protein
MIWPEPADFLYPWTSEALSGLARQDIGFDAVDGDLVRKFLTHDCDCPRPPGGFLTGRAMLRASATSRAGRRRFHLPPSTISDGQHNVDAAFPSPG